MKLIISAINPFDLYSFFTAPVNIIGPVNEQRDRSLTVMIPRAKYRATSQSATPQGYRPMSSFALDEHKLIEYLETGGRATAQRKPTFSNNTDFQDSEGKHRVTKQQSAGFGPSGALVSAGFQVSMRILQLDVMKF